MVETCDVLKVFTWMWHLSLLLLLHLPKGVTSPSPMSMEQKVHFFQWRVGTRERPHRDRLGGKAVDIVMYDTTPSWFGLGSRLPQDLGSSILFGWTSGI